MNIPNPGLQPGRSGNPAGRPKGSRNRATLALEAIVEGEASSRKAIELALAGDGPAMTLCLDRLRSPRRESRDPIGDLRRLAICDYPHTETHAQPCACGRCACGETHPMENWHRHRARLDAWRNRYLPGEALFT